MEFYCYSRSHVIEAGTLLDRILVVLHKDIDAIMSTMNTLEKYDFWEIDMTLWHNRETQVISNKNNVLYPIRKAYTSIYKAKWFASTAIV